MKQRKSILVLVSLGILVISPMAWGCEGSGMELCAMSDCPMTEEAAVDDCHPIEGMGDEPMNAPQMELCAPSSTSWTDCCSDSIAVPSASLDSSPIQKDLRSLATAHRTDRIESKPPSRISYSGHECLASQQHDLGRFTLLSSFLL